MERIFLSVFLFTFLLTACEPLLSDTTLPPAESPTPTFQVQQADIPPGDSAPWQMAYAAFLTDLRQREGELRQWVRNASESELKNNPELSYASGSVSDSYFLYDIDKDGIPELLIQYGISTVSYYTFCYTYQDEKVIELGGYPSGRCSLYSLPQENGVLSVWTHMTHIYISKYSIENEKFVFQKTLYEDNIAGPEQKEFPPPREIISGAEEIPGFDCSNWANSPDKQALLLPIFDFNSPPRQNQNPLEESQVRLFINDALLHGKEFYPVSDDQVNSSAPTTLEKYLSSDGIYLGQPSEPLEYAWADINGDGQTDCILRMVNHLEGYNRIHYVIFNMEEEALYAYFVDNIVALGIDPDGSVAYRRSSYFENSWSEFRFYKNQLYSIPTATPVEGCDLAWGPFPQTP